MDHSPGGIVLAAVALLTPALCQADAGPSEFFFAYIQEQGNNIVVTWDEASCDPRQHRLGRENCHGAETVFEGDLASMTTKQLIDNKYNDPDCRFYRYSLVDGCPEAGPTTYSLLAQQEDSSWIELGSESAMIEHDTDVCGTPCAPDTEADADADEDEEPSTGAGDGGTGCNTAGGGSWSFAVLLLYVAILMREQRARAVDIGCGRRTRR